MSKKIILSCDSCGTRNYSVPARSNHSTERLSLKKFCSRCNAHTIHKQTA
ncbi:50S ribosomal protein L33 [Sporosarcina sp. ACRSM]|uniref:Large ribosomal subunit protein bL33 n=1 Tax=Sporosarcina soli TaxID=334736 RepID=A0ABW0TM05_9BACL|nr:50S ribosomal protein L33 [Sporosarcina sp. ACRSM]MCG7335339.1 50S ribosomal protein L33 [Sporosarcina sp. ACRSM]